MDIDWTIVAAQVFNFALLVWLLNRFLYRPIVNVISAREEAVRERMAKAESLQEEARRELAAYQAQRTEFESAREQLLRAAREEAKAIRDNLLQEAAAEAENQRRRFKEQLAAERVALERSVQEGIVKQAGAVAQKLLRDMGGSTIGDGVIEALRRRLEEQSSDWVDMAPPIAVRLSFEPTPEQRARLREILSQLMDIELSDGDISIVHDESLLIGAELHYDGTVIVWHAADYVGSWVEDALGRVVVESEGDPDATGA